MKRLACLLTLFTLAFLPSQAGVSISVRVGGGGGFHGFYGGSGGHARGYSCYSYRPCYSSYFYYPAFYSAPIYYDDYSSIYSPYAYPNPYAYPPVPAVPPPAATDPEPTAKAPLGPPAAVAASMGSLPTGKLDDFGYVHSPYTTSTFKVPNLVDGQALYDPATRQVFRVRLNEAQLAALSAKASN